MKVQQRAGLGEVLPSPVCTAETRQTDVQAGHKAGMAGEYAETARGILANKGRHAGNALRMGGILKHQLEALHVACFDIVPRM